MPDPISFHIYSLVYVKFIVQVHSGIDIPQLFIFSKMHTRTFLLQLPAYKLFESRGHRPNHTQNCLVKVIRGQTFCPLFIVLKNVCMIKSQFPHHLLSYVRSKWDKLPQDTTEDIQSSNPPAYCTPHLFTFRLFKPPVNCHPLLLRTGE